MFRFAAVSVICVLGVCGVAYAEAAFTQALTAEEKRSAGLEQLTPDQLAQLNGLVERYKTGALADARQAAEKAEAERQSAEQAKRTAEADKQAADAARIAAEAQAARAAAQVEEMKAKTVRAEAAQKKAEEHASKLNLIARAKGILKFDAKADEPLAESTIIGKFHGWGPRQVFTLANGQRWQVANNESYYAPAADNVRVQILPASLFGYWMRFPDLQAQVRVNFVSEK